VAAPKSKQWQAFAFSSASTNCQDLHSLPLLLQVFEGSVQSFAVLPQGATTGV